MLTDFADVKIILSDADQVISQLGFDLGDFVTDL
jgi:hypothetical protein